MARLPSQLTYNDLNGKEATEILVDWFRQLLSQQPLLQPHLTLPMARIQLDIDVKIDMFIGGTVPVASDPETVRFSGQVALGNMIADYGNEFRNGPVGRPINATDAPATRPEHTSNSTSTRLSTVINAAPIPGGNPPDKVRESHNLPVPRPGYGSRDTGSHLFLADVLERMEEQQTGRRSEPPPLPTIATGEVPPRRQGIVAEGYVFAPELPVSGVVSTGSAEQSIPIDRGSVDIDLTGQGRMKNGGYVVTAGSHQASVKEFGDGKGPSYGSVSGTYDAGPAGLANGGGGRGLYGDGRTRLQFGNNNKG